MTIGNYQPGWTMSGLCGEVGRDVSVSFVRYAAAEIRIRAERRDGQLIEVQRDSVGLNKGAEGNPGGVARRVVRDVNGPTHPTLADMGIDKRLADRARKLAAVPTQTFEDRVLAWRAAGTDGVLVRPTP